MSETLPKKYEGLDGTELAISESQERMAVLIDKDDEIAFKELAKEENLESTLVAKITNDNRLKMIWNNKIILDISRDFLNTNGIKQKVNIRVINPNPYENYFNLISSKNYDNLKEAWLNNLRDLNICNQKGLIERFDSTVGAGTVLMSFGGKYQLTQTEGMVAKIPLLKGETNTCTIMTYGYNPKLAKWSPFHSGIYAILDSIAKVTAMGGDYKRIRLTLQEYFEKLGKDEQKWSKPFTMLLGAFYIQKKLDIPAIGGKDSMSGTFKNMNVPPTLVSFAVCTANANQIISPEFKNSDNFVILLSLKRDENELPNFDMLDKNYSTIYKLIQAGKILSIHTIGYGGIAASISKMCFGNKIGIIFNNIEHNELFNNDYGSLILEIDKHSNLEQLFEGLEYRILGITSKKPIIKIHNITLDIDLLIETWNEPLKDIFPIKEDIIGTPKKIIYKGGNKLKNSIKIAKPRIFIPIFPGINCEYETQKAFEKAGGINDILILKNLTSKDIEESIEHIIKKINNSQIIALAGGFSAGDEPDGAGKFIATVFRNPKIKEAVMNLLNNRDGLILGVCNGFQALIKLGLLPYGEIKYIDKDSPTLTFNKIGRHISKMAHTKITSNLSMWFNNTNVGDIHTITFSNGEGRFVANKEQITKMIRNGQIATQYIDFKGNPTYDGNFNPSGSFEAIEAITSPDGRILGKMGHSERIGSNICKNIQGNKNQKIFEAGVEYFRG